MAEDKIMTSFQGYEVVDKKARDDIETIFDDVNVITTKEETADALVINKERDGVTRKVASFGAPFDQTLGDGTVVKGTKTALLGQSVTLQAHKTLAGGGVPEAGIQVNYNYTKETGNIALVATHTSIRGDRISLRANSNNGMMFCGVGRPYYSSTGASDNVDNLVLTSELNCVKTVTLNEAITATSNITNDNTKVGIDGIFSNISWGDGTINNEDEHTYAFAGKYKFVASGCPSCWCLSAFPCDEIKVEDTVTELPNNALCAISAKSITIGRNVTNIGSKALWGLRNCTHLEFLNPTPIAPYNPDWFEGDGVGIPDTLKIYVPYDSLEAYREVWTPLADKITSIAEMNDVEQLKNKVDNCVAKTGHTGRSVIGVRGVTGDPTSDIPFSVDDDGATIAYRDSNGGLGVGNVDYSSGNRAVNANSFPGLLKHHLQQTDITQYLDMWAKGKGIAKLVNGQQEIENGGRNRWYTTDMAYSTFETETNGIYFEGYATLSKQNRNFINKNGGERIFTRYELDITIEHLWTNSQKTEKASLPAVAIRYLLETKAYRWNLYFPVSDAIQAIDGLVSDGQWGGKTTLEIKNEIMSAKYMEIAEYSWRWLPEVGETTNTSMLNGNGAVTAQPAYLRFRNDGDNTVYTQFWAMGTAIELDTYNEEPLTIDGAHMKVYIYKE